MGAGKNKSHRKKRISKHVLQAEERKKQEEVEKQLLSAAENGKGTTDSGSNAPSTTTLSSTDVVAKNSATPEQQAAAAADSKQKTSTPSSSSKKINTRDPDIGSSYLSLWNYDRRNSTKQWKFNKNTQSWLLRHMYDSDKVTKTTFATLVDYLCQGGDRAMSRVEEDAKMRARRYKDWEKREQLKKKEAEGGDDGEENNGADKNGVEIKGKEKKKQSSSEGDASWNGMDDHDKRKEYKRARKVLDALKEAREGVSK
ncbi:hypothetical protein ACHAXR_008562 [Thalassiosira sp. AJA248-18]